MEIEDAIAVAVVSAICTSALNGVVAASILAFVSHRFAESRDIRGRRDQLRLELYTDLIQLILKNEEELGGRDQTGKPSPIPLQAERLGIRHRLRLLGSTSVNEHYAKYAKLVFRSTNLPMDQWPPRNDVDLARDELVNTMAIDVSNGASGTVVARENGRTPMPPSTADAATLFTEQNKLLWGRLKTAYLIEAGALVAFYVTAANAPWQSVVILLFSVFLLLLLFLLVCRDVQHLQQLNHPAVTPIRGLIFDQLSGRLVALVVPATLLIANSSLAIWKYASIQGWLLGPAAAPWIIGIPGFLLILGSVCIVVLGIQATGVLTRRVE